MKEFVKKILGSLRDWGIPFVLAIIFSVSMYGFVTDYARKYAQSAAETELQTVFEKNAQLIASRIEQLRTSGETAALLSRAFEEEMRLPDLQDAAAAIKEATGSAQVLVSDTDGNAVSSEGGQEKLDLEEYIRDSAGKRSQSIWYGYTPDSEEGKADHFMRVIIPVCHGEDTEPYAYLICADDMTAWFRDEETDKIKTFYRAIVNRSGKGFVLSGTIPENALENIWTDLAEETGQKENGIRKTLSSFRTMSMGTDAGEMYFIVPLKTEDTMYLVVKVAKEAIQSKKNREIRKVGKLLQKLEFLTLAFIFLYAAYTWFRHKITFQNTEKLEKSATTDPLTGLKNKMTMEREIREYMEENPDDQGLMFLLDLDNFKTINDTKGHAFGDQVLKEFSFRLSSYFRAADLVGRIGGDEFMVFCPHFSDEAAIAYKIESLEAFAKTFSVGTVMIQKVSCSIGLAYYPKDGANFETLYKAADEAMYRSKKGGKARISM